MPEQTSLRHSFPAFLDLTDKRVVVIGAGKAAAGKLNRLLGHGAFIELIAPQLDAELSQLVDQHGLLHQARPWQAVDLRQASLVIAATGDAATDGEIAAAARREHCWVNVAGQPALSSFLLPSLIDRSPLVVAVSSGGASPVLARLLRARIDAFLPHSFSQLGQLADRYRERITQALSERRQRRRFWEELLDGRLGEMVLQEQEAVKADRLLDQALTTYKEKGAWGEVYLVGAGPGDPDLLTFRALRLMQQCDVVLYDRLVSEPIMALVNPAATKIYVGKQRSEHAVPQESINTLLVKHARKGRRVLRLKGGDPFIFGRGGEEIETLAAEGVIFQVVPGITAAAGCASYAGIPLTHRDHAQSCLFVTGHLKDGKVDLDWQALTRLQQTVVIYMGLVGMPYICQQLIRHGLPESHPIAIVSQGTLSQQQVITGTLATLPERVAASSVKPPTLIIIGTVVSLRERLAWFDRPSNGGVSHRLIRFDQLKDGAPQRVVHESHGILLCRVGDTVHAVQDTCTHEDVSLSLGALCEHRLRCPLHGSEFDIRTGRVLNEPADVDLKVFSVEIEDGWVYLQD